MADKETVPRPSLALMELCRLAVPWNAVNCTMNARLTAATFFRILHFSDLDSFTFPLGESSPGSPGCGFVGPPVSPSSLNASFVYPPPTEMTATSLSSLPPFPRLLIPPDLSSHFATILSLFSDNSQVAVTNKTNRH